MYNPKKYEKLFFDPDSSDNIKYLGGKILFILIFKQENEREKIF